MEIVHVQLSDERRKVIVLEVLGEDDLAEQVGVPDEEALTLGELPTDDIVSLWILHYLK